MLHALDDNFHVATTRPTRYVAQGRASGKQVSFVLRSNKQQKTAEMGAVALFGAAGLGALFFTLIERGPARYLSGAMFLIALFMFIAFSRRK